MLEHLRSMPRCESLRVAAVLRSYSYSLEDSGRRCRAQRDREQQGIIIPLTLTKRPGPGGRGGAVSLESEHATLMVGQSTDKEGEA